jgi:SOS-response transcriptional repressor LexA
MNGDIEVIITGRATKQHPYVKEGVVVLEITERQGKVFEYIASRLDSLECPSLRDIMAEIGVNSINSVQNTIKRLKESGLIESVHGMHRSIRLTRFGSLVWKKSKEERKAHEGKTA